MRPSPVSEGHIERKTGLKIGGLGGEAHPPAPENQPGFYRPSEIPFKTPTAPFKNPARAWVG